MHLLKVINLFVVTKNGIIKQKIIYTNHHYKSRVITYLVNIFLIIIIPN
jgi:hypothetical protein